ncbi:hypothetical protein FD967_10395 [Polynucleobacter sp. JS-Mosq-20-D10]|uniref:hypothetical protein n=1 Tax=Polynucleobacter sp. JS-Mosq-20-D10 TaxID=2576922 RepID=UPI001BFCF52E|nr:hypothetical protein [Polynucleobacter sp. JS-Mosq-20-D10]QWE00417.1 hypothetical protein FD967_10395 [Polynucleobacter sp. JS-Mosq-20-D10]
MKRLVKLTTVMLLVVFLGGCLASSSSPVGVSCNYGTGKPFWDLPIECQGR